MKRFVYILLAILAVLPTYAQERVVTQRVVIDIPFILAGSTEEDIHDEIDSVELAKSVNELKSLAADKSSVVKSVEFYSSVSPEGTCAINWRLGKERLATAERVVRGILPISDSIVVTRDERYIPWHTYLLPEIMADSTVPYRDELIKLIYRKPGAKGPDRRRVRLKYAHGGKLWKVVEERYFAYMRRGGAIITVDRVLSEDMPVLEDLRYGVTPITKDMLNFDAPAPVETTVVEPAVEPEAVSAISIKTNALGVAALVTNIGFEVKLAPRWSLDVIGAYSPYNMIVKDRKIRLFGIRPEARFWWGTPMKRGHFLGLHGFTSAFNVQIGDKARYQDPNHALWGLGLAYGYALPLGKKERWGVEFTIGLGYARIKYDKYDGVINGQFIERKLVNYFGPTRLGVNFSYRFDIEGKSNKGKR